jgi:L-ascorbate metabolism protein UlaG (beta-lactamase superfamily)
MEITYIGHSCFKIKGKDVTLVIDPYDPNHTGYKLPKLEADVVLITHNHPDHANYGGVTGYHLLIDGPGEYETKDVFVSGLKTNHDDKGGSERGPNTIYLIDIDGITILHLGDLGHELEQSTLEKIDFADVLLIPVGGKYTIDSETASKVISSIEPGIVIPMHYSTPDLKIEGLDDLSKFLDEMGAGDTVKKLEKLKINSKGDIPEETEIVVLQQNH